MYYYEKAADQGDGDAQNILGRCYQSGYGVEKDYKKAVKYYQLASDQEHLGAKYNLGCCYQNGAGVDQDIVKAFSFFLPAAKQGHTASAEIIEKTLLELNF